MDKCRPSRRPSSSPTHVIFRGGALSPWRWEGRSRPSSRPPAGFRARNRPPSASTRVPQTGEPRPRPDLGAADAVVRKRCPQHRLIAPDLDGDHRCARMPDRVGEHFRDDIVDGDLDRRRGPLHDIYVDVDRDRRPSGESSQRRTEPDAGQRRRMEPAENPRTSSRTDSRSPSTWARAECVLRRSCGIVARTRWRSRPNAKSRCCVPSWRSRSIRRRASSPAATMRPPRCDEVGARSCVQYRRRDQVGELAQADLRSLRDRLLSGRDGDDRSPGMALDDDRHANGRPEPDTSGGRSN